MIRDRKGVCYDYSEFFYALCTKAGIRCQLIYGRANGGEHAWNRVRINGKWKYIDVTWNDETGSKDWYLDSGLWKDHRYGGVQADNNSFLK